MDEVVLAAYIAGIFTVFGTLAGAALTFLFVILKERSNRINNQNRLMVELILLKSAFDQIKKDVESVHEIKSSNDLDMIALVWNNATPKNKIKKLQKLFKKSIIPDIGKSLIFARFTGVRNLISSFEERIVELYKLDEFSDHKKCLIEYLDLIIEIHEKIIVEIYELRFINLMKNRIKTLWHQIVSRFTISA